MLNDYLPEDYHKEAKVWEKEFIDECSTIRAGFKTIPSRNQSPPCRDRIAKQQYDARVRRKALPYQLAIDYYKARSKVIEEEAKTIQGSQSLSYDQYPISIQRFMQHCHIHGPSGSGKTQLIQQMLLSFIYRKDSPGLGVLEPKGLMIDRVARLKCFDPLNGSQGNRLVQYRPRLADPAPPLNIFAPIADPCYSGETRCWTRLYLFPSGDHTHSKNASGLQILRPFVVHHSGVDLLPFISLLEAETDVRFASSINKARRHCKQDSSKTASSPPAQGNETADQRPFQQLAHKARLMATFCSKSPSLNMSEMLANRKIVLVNTAMAEDAEAESILSAATLSARPWTQQ